jgi:transposase-like protein
VVRIYVTLRVGETSALRQNGDVARPSVLTPERSREVEARLAGGASIKSAAEAIGVNPRTLGRWLAEGRVRRRSLKLVSDEARSERRTSVAGSSSEPS